MITFFSILALGFFLGIRHATDPDHVIAITTIVTRERSIRRSTTVGILWGVGHTLTILLVGGMVILFGLVIPPRLGLTMEFSVALMLVLLGMFNLRAFRKSVDEIASDRAESATFHSHFHHHWDNGDRYSRRNDPAQQGQERNDPPQGRFERLIGRLGLYHTLRPLVVGSVHGLAGSAAIALLILATIRNPAWAMAYLLVFGLGTIAGMTLITTAIAIPSAYGARRLMRANRYLIVASGVLSFAFGLFLAYQISFVGGLFSDHPIWIPK